MIVPILGLVGIATAPRRHRVFLVSGLLVGITLTMLGHLGPVNAVGADAVNNLLDTSASALRNTHKFELVVRVPLALGAARAFTWIRHVVIRNQVWMPLRRVMVAALVLMISAPANGLLAKPEGYVAIPAFWRQAAQWLDANATQGTTMSVPATSFADFVWGSTKDDPLQALGNGRFVTRDAVPLGTAGTTRWLDELERLMGTGQGGETLAAGLRLGGVQHVLVRNDLRSDVIDGPNKAPVMIREYIETFGMSGFRLGGPCLQIWNGSISGSKMADNLARIERMCPRWTGCAPVGINSSHNQGATFNGPAYIASLDALLTAIRARISSPRFVLNTQNPKYSPQEPQRIDAQARRSTLIREIAAQRDYDLIDAYPAFGTDSALVKTDGIHPQIGTGSAIWAAAAWAACGIAT